MPSLFASDPVASGPYLVYRLESTIIWDAQLLELPVAYVTGTAQGGQYPGFNIPAAQRQAPELVPTAAPVGYRVVTFDLLRWGNPPQLPDPTPGPNETLKSMRVTTAAPLVQPDGVSFVQQAKGFYLYVLTVPPWPITDPLPGVSTPASTDLAQSNRTTTDQFANGLVDHGELFRSS